MAQNAVRLESVPIPEALHELLVAQMGQADLSTWASEAVVVEAVREHMISRRKAATLLGYSDSASREAFFERHGLHLEYTMEMLEQDFGTIDKYRS